MSLKQNMKTIIIAVGIVIAMGVVVQMIPSTTEVIQGEQTEVTIEVEPDWATDEDAKQAAKDVIQRKAWEADKERLEGQIEALQTQYEADLDALKLDLDDVDKNLGIY